MIEIVLLTGPSGAGKTTVQYVFEESGYVVMENIVPLAMGVTLDYLLSLDNKRNKILFIVPPTFAKEAREIILNKGNEISFKMIVLDCDFHTLFKRFKLTRHVHPLTVLNKISLTTAINEDKKAIDDIAILADFVIDTTTMDAVDLRKFLFKLLNNKTEEHVSVVFMSYGQKYGNPMDADLILDTRALPNPYWDTNLRHYSGLDKEIVKYLESFDSVEECFKNMVNYLNYYLDLVQKDGRGNYTIGVCCSGGRHRSVYFARRLGDYYAKKYNTYVFHRDINKDK